MLEAARLLPVAVSATLAAALLLVSVVSAAVRHTQELPAGFVAIEAAAAEVPRNVLETAASDLNGDGVVGRADVNQVVTVFGLHEVESLVGDVNGDGTVDILDLAVVGSNFGAVVDARES